MLEAGGVWELWAAVLGLPHNRSVQILLTNEGHGSLGILYPLSRDNGDCHSWDKWWLPYVCSRLGNVLAVPC